MEAGFEVDGGLGIAGDDGDGSAADGDIVGPCVGVAWEGEPCGVEDADVEGEATGGGGGVEVHGGGPDGAAGGGVAGVRGAMAVGSVAEDPWDPRGERRGNGGVRGGVGGWDGGGEGEEPCGEPVEERPGGDHVRSLPAEAGRRQNIPGKPGRERSADGGGGSDEDAGVVAGFPAGRGIWWGPFPEDAGGAAVFGEDGDLEGRYGDSGESGGGDDDGVGALLEAAGDDAAAGVVFDGFDVHACVDGDGDAAAAGDDGDAGDLVGFAAGFGDCGVGAGEGELGGLEPIAAAAAEGLAAGFVFAEVDELEPVEFPAVGFAEEAEDDGVFGGGAAIEAEVDLAEVDETGGIAVLGGVETGEAGESGCLDDAFEDGAGPWLAERDDLVAEAELAVAGGVAGEGGEVAAFHGFGPADVGAFERAAEDGIDAGGPAEGREEDGGEGGHEAATRERDGHC